MRPVTKQPTPRSSNSFSSSEHFVNVIVQADVLRVADGVVISGGKERFLRCEKGSFTLAKTRTAKVAKVKIE